MQRDFRNSVTFSYLETKISLSRESAVIASICNHRSLNQSQWKESIVGEGNAMQTRFICRSYLTEYRQAISQN